MAGQRRRNEATAQGPTRRDLFGFAAAGGAAFALSPLAAPPVQARPRPNGRADFKLFSRGRIGGMTLKNRIVRSAAFENGGDGQGYVADPYIDIHTAYARGGAGLIITGYMAVMEWGQKPRHVAAYHDRFIPGLARVAQAVHAADEDVKLVAEIGHDGTSPTEPGRISPSGLNWEGKAEGHVMSAQEIEQFCVDMAEASRRLKEAGFDGVEIHGAHHYLINTFLSPFTNRRDDEYGGSLQKRVALVRNMVACMREGVGEDFPILIKLNCDDGPVDDGFPGETDLDSFPHLVAALVATGVDAIDVSGSERPGDPLRSQIDNPKDQSYYRPYAERLDEPVPVILGCGNRNVELLEYFLQLGSADFVSFARPLVREPDLPNRWLAGRGTPEADCISCNLCFRALYSGQPVHCVQLERQRQGVQPSAA